MNFKKKNFIINNIIGVGQCPFSHDVTRRRWLECNNTYTHKQLYSKAHQLNKDNICFVIDTIFFTTTTILQNFFFTN